MDELDQKERDLIASLPSVVAKNAQVVEDAGLPTGHAAEAPPEAPRLTPEIMAQLDREHELQQKFGSNELETAALSAASAATLSLSDRLLTGAGVYSKQDLNELRERNPVSDVLGTGGGILIPALLSGGASVPAQAAEAAGQVALKSGLKTALTTAGELAMPASAITRAGRVAEALTAKAVSKVIADQGSKSIARSVLRKSIEQAAQGGVEGGLYGLNSLLREDALGNADLNAENLMAHIGTGALYGGLVGGALPSVGAAVTGSAKAGKNIFDKVLQKYANPAKAAEELTGFTGSKLAKMNGNPGQKAMLDDLGRWYAEDVKIGLTDKADDILKKVDDLKSESGRTIDMTLRQADAAASGTAAKSPEMRRMLYNEIADSIESKYGKPFEGLEIHAAHNKDVSKLLRDLRRRAAKPAPLTGEDLVEMKRLVDKAGARFYERGIGAAPSQYEKALFKTRDLLNKASQRYVDAVDPALGQTLKKANQNYSYAATVYPSLLKKSVKDTSLVGFKDALYATTGGLLGGEGVAAAVIIGKKALESDLRRKLVILSGIEKANMSVASRTKDAVSTFFAKGTRPAKSFSIAALTSSALAQKRQDGKRPESPKNRLEAYKNTAENINDLLVHSDKLLDKSVKAGQAISYAAPKTAEMVGQRTISALQFLQSKIPKRPYEALFPSGKEKPYEPSSMELAKFERYLQIVDNPMSALEELQSGTLTREHVEALQKVYPALYSHMQQQVLDQLQDEDEGAIPYAKKVNLSMLLNIPGDASLLGKNIAGLQSTFQPESGEAQSQGAAPVVNPTAGGAKSLDTASRTASGTQAFLQRRSEKP